MSASDSDSDDGDSENPLQSIVGGAKWVFGGRLLKMAIVFLSQVVVARVLGASFYGGIAQVMAVAGIAGLVGTLGVGTGISRQLAYYEDDPTQARGIIRAGFVIGLIGTTIIAAGLFLAAPFIATEVFDDNNIIVLLQVVAVGIPFGFLANLGVSMAKASRDASVHTYINQFLRPLTDSAFRIGAAVLGFGAVGVITGNVLARVLTAVVAIALAIRAVPISLRGSAESMYSQLATFSFPLLFASGFNFLIGDIDTFLLGVFEASAAVGIYTAAFKLRPMILLFFFPATYLIGPVLTRLQKEKRPVDARRTYTVISKWTTIATLPLVLLLLLFPETVLSVSFGAAYITPSSVVVLRLLSVSMLVNVMLGANDRAVVALGHNRMTLWIAAVAFTVNLSLDIALIPQFGIIGAAVASTLAFMSRDVINTVLLYRWHGLFPLSRGIYRVLVVLSLVVPIGYVTFTQIFPVSFVSVTAVGILFLILYVPLAVRLGIEGAADVELFDEIEENQNVDLTPLRRGILWIYSL